jgi:polyisoprenyl-phosphate glycosyltransferase
MIEFSVVIPVYGGSLTLSDLVGQIDSFFKSKNLSFEIILVHDCGFDNSWEVINKLYSEYANIKAIKLTRNFGQHNAIICGFKHAEGSFIITMDEDLQHSPSDIEKLIDKQRSGGFDIVYGKYETKKYSFFRKTTSDLLQQLIKLGIPELHKDYSSFRIIKSSIAKYTLDFNNSYTFIDGYLAWITKNVTSVTVDHFERSAGKSAYSIKRLTEHAVNIFVTFSILPIRFITMLSFVTVFFLVAFSSYLVLRKIIFDDLVSGYTSISLILGIGFSAVLFGIGVIGEYLFRINLKTTNKPNFIEEIVLEQNRSDSQ